MISTNLSNLAWIAVEGRKKASELAVNMPSTVLVVIDQTAISRVIEHALE